MNEIENNKLIAEFMDLPKCQNECKDKCGSYKCLDGMHHTIKDMKYLSSWDWLMPVVEKIEDIYLMGCQAYITIGAFEINGYCSGNLVKGLSEFNYQINGRKLSSTDKLTATYNTVVQFIKWYNTTKN